MVASRDPQVQLQKAFGTVYGTGNLLKPVGVGAVASQGSVQQMFAALGQLAATPALQAAIARVQPLSNRLDANMVSAMTRLISAGPAATATGGAGGFGPQEATRGLMMLYVDASTRSGKYNAAGGAAEMAIMKLQDLQGHRLADITLALANYTNQTGQVDDQAAAELRRESDAVAQLSDLGVKLSQAADRMTDAQAQQVGAALTSFSTHQDIAPLARVVSSITGN